MDPEQALKRKREINKSKSTILERHILRGAINGVSRSNAASKSRIIRPSVPPRRRNRTKSKSQSVLEEVGLESLRVSKSRDVQTLAVSFFDNIPLCPWAFCSCRSCLHLCGFRYSDIHLMSCERPLAQTSLRLYASAACEFLGLKQM